MTAVPLGLRSGSCGSLYQQLQNGPFSETQPISLRRASRSLSGIRERERILHRIYKFVGRRKVGILLMLMISVTVLSFVSVISRDEDSLVGSTTHVYLENLSIKSSKSPFMVPHEESSATHNTSLISLPTHRTTPHPCERFPVSSPPMDKRHTGPRSCPVCYIPVEQALLRMPYSTSPSPALKNLHYFSEDSLISYEPNGGSNFGGLPSLLHRNESFMIRESMTVHCGFLNFCSIDFSQMLSFLFGLMENFSSSWIPIKFLRDSCGGKTTLLQYRGTTEYRRSDVFEEAEANKAAGKYDNASIDHQIEFYKKEGLTPYSLSKLPITSDVPEGCVIIREHMLITNLFTCLWFNEVDRFTSRDQISFSTARDKIMSQVDWTIDMFMDCERRNFVVQAYHRDLLDQQRKALASMRHPPPAAAVLTRDKIKRVPPSRKLPGKTPSRRGSDKRSGSRRRHPRVITGRL